MDRKVVVMLKIHRENKLKERLEEVRVLWDRNYAKLVMYHRVDPRGKAFRLAKRTERYLTAQETTLKKELNIYVYDPCPLGLVKACNECSGRIERTFIRIGCSGQEITKLLAVTIGGFKCPLKDSAIRKRRNINI